MKVKKTGRKWGKGPRKGSKYVTDYDWPVIKARYVFNGETPAQIAKGTHLSVGTITQKAFREGWRLEREAAAKQIEEDIAQAARQEAVKRFLAGAADVEDVRAKVAANLKERFSNPAFKAEISDFVAISKLAADFSKPGWSRAPGEGSTTVNVSIGSVLEKAREERRAALSSEDLEIRVDPELPGPDQEAAYFLLQEDETEDES